MSKIIGATVGTPISPKRIEDKIKPVKTVNNQEPDENGNVNIDVPTKMSDLDNDLDYAQVDDIPTKVSLLENDAGYAKKTDIPTVPTQTSQLTNNSGFITKAVSDLTNYYLKSETLTKTEINALVSAIPKFAIEVVSTLPTSNISATTVYLVKSGSGGDLYTEYIRVNNAWEILGSQKVDLTGYAKLTDIPTKMSELENDRDYAQLDDIPAPEVYVGDGAMPGSATLQIIVDEDEVIPGYSLQAVVDAVLAALPTWQGGSY